MAYSHSEVVKVANVRIEEPGHVEPAEQNRLRVDGPVYAVERGDGHPDPRAVAPEEDIADPWGKDLDASVDSQRHFCDRFRCPEG
jgi:hypothetical protein